MTLLFPAALMLVFLIQLHGYSAARRFIDLVVTTQREIDSIELHRIYTHVTTPGPQDPWWHGYASRPARTQLV